MYCRQCRKQLSEGSRYCDGCGAAQQTQTAQRSLAPVKETPPAEMREEAPVNEKKRKKWLIPAIALVAVLALAAVFLIPVLFPATETVYVLTSKTWYDNNGNGTLTLELKYDEQGHVISASYIYPPTEYLPSGHIAEYEWKYDEKGNVTKQTFSNPSGYLYKDAKYSYDLRYAGNGQIRSCEVKIEATNEIQYACDFTYNKNGDLVLVEYEHDDPQRYYGHGSGFKGSMRRNQWDAYEYDGQHRLIQETFSMETGSMTPLGAKQVQEQVLYRFTYSYGEDGALETVRFAAAEADRYYSNEELTDEIFEKCMITSFSWTIIYDRDGKAIGRQGGESTMPGKSIADWEYDDQGNLLGERYDDGSKSVMRYEEMELSEKDASRVRQTNAIVAYDGTVMESSIILKEDVYGVCDLDFYTLGISQRAIHPFYYALIPNPGW